MGQGGSHHQLWAKGCLLSLFTHPTRGAHVNQQPNAGFPLFLQTRSLYQLAFTFKKSVPWGRYGNPFSFSTSRDLSVVLLFFLNFGPLLHLDLTTNAPQGGTLLDFVWTSIPGCCLLISLTWNPFLQKLFLVWASVPQSMCREQQDTCEGWFYHVASNSCHSVW